MYQILFKYQALTRSLFYSSTIKFSDLFATIPFGKIIKIINVGEPDDHRNDMQILHAVEGQSSSSN